MPNTVYNNVEGHRLIDDGRVVEDVTSITLPTLEHSTNTIAASGMSMDVDMPDLTHLKAMDYSIAHNNGRNSKYLATPGKHSNELRLVRQRYNVASGEIQHESVKYRLTGVHVKTDKGKIETGNPYGSTDSYSLLRYEEEIDGEIVTIIDAMAGIIKFNGVSYNDAVENLLA